MSLAAHVLFEASELLGDDPSSDDMPVEYQRGVLDLAVRVLSLDPERDTNAVAAMLGIDFLQEEAKQQIMDRVHQVATGDSRSNGNPTNAEIREWANKNGFKVGKTGMIPYEVREHYRIVHSNSY